MIKANELRIGNWYFDGHEIDQISPNVLMRFAEETLIGLTVEPIPLTKEWLINFGFKEPANGYWEIDNFLINFEDEEFNIAFVKFKKLQHVHQLQNLYFALTGEELTIDDRIIIDTDDGEERGIRL